MIISFLIFHTIKNKCQLHTLTSVLSNQYILLRAGLPDMAHFRVVFAANTPGKLGLYAHIYLK